MQATGTPTETVRFEQNHEAERPVGRSIQRGMLNTCPACGSGRLFGRFLRTVENCAACGERLDHHRADDFPPYIVVTIMGHLVLGGFMATEMLLPMSNWAHLAIWVPITIVGSLLLMQPVKGGVVGLQWALRMHGFGGHEDRPEDDIPTQGPSS
jgi:uncharacterized protein (DUF983 family)